LLGLLRGHPRRNLQILLHRSTKGQAATEAEQKAKVSTWAGAGAGHSEQRLQHCITLPGEIAPNNPRQKAPIPPQGCFPSGEGWKALDCHSALGSYCTLFIDDILVYSKTFEDHV